MPRPEQVVKFECDIVARTDKAVQIKTEDDFYWVPLSVITNAEDLPDLGSANVHIQWWFVEKEEIS